MSRAVLVATGDPAAAAEQMLAAWRTGEIPVVVDPQWPPGVAGSALDAARRLPAHGSERMVLLTSGSSGRPRSVLRTLQSWTASYPALDAAAGIGPAEVLWAPGRAASTLTLFAAMHARLTGHPLLATGRWRGVPAEADRAQVLHAVPAVLPVVLAARTAGALPALRLAVLGGSPLPDGLRAVAAGLGIEVVSYYGAAELSFVAIDADGAGLRAFPGVRLRVHGGRIEVRSAFLAQGYLGSEPLQDGAGWAGVGDRGTLHDGVLRVLGRGDGALDVGGHTVELAEVESVLRGVAGVADLVCVGEPDPLLGSHLVGLVRPEPGSDPVPRLRAAARVLHRPARPVRWVLLERLPLTPAGKPDRPALARLAARPQL